MNGKRCRSSVRHESPDNTFGYTRFDLINDHLFLADNSNRNLKRAREVWSGSAGAGRRGVGLDQKSVNCTKRTRSLRFPAEHKRRSGQMVTSNRPFQVSKQRAGGHIECLGMSSDGVRSFCYKHPLDRLLLLSPLLCPV
jgi:hypothetical protein